jgi:tetratricopeptide (TPR) repeat protein
MAGRMAKVSADKMRTAITCILLILGTFPAFADDAGTLTKKDAIEAFRHYRAGVKMISAIHADLMQLSITAEPNEGVKIPKERIGAYEQARGHLEKSIALNPYFPEAYVFLANSYWELENDLAKTAEYYGKALEIDPDYDDVISARGQVFVLLERIEEAERDLQRLEALGSAFAKSLREQIAALKAKRENPQPEAEERPR